MVKSSGGTGRGGAGGQISTGWKNANLSQAQFTSLTGTGADIASPEFRRTGNVLSTRAAQSQRVLATAMENRSSYERSNGTRGRNVSDTDMNVYARQKAMDAGLVGARNVYRSNIDRGNPVAQATAAAKANYVKTFKEVLSDYSDAKWYRP